MQIQTSLILLIFAVMYTRSFIQARLVVIPRPRLLVCNLFLWYHQSKHMVSCTHMDIHQ